MLPTSTEEVQIKTKKPIAIWNVRTLHQEGQLDLLLDELKTINICYQHCRYTRSWCSGVGEALQPNGYRIILSGREDDTYRQVVTLTVSTEYAHGLLSYDHREHCK